MLWTMSLRDCSFCLSSRCGGRFPMKSRSSALQRSVWDPRLQAAFASARGRDRLSPCCGWDGAVPRTELSHLTEQPELSTGRGFALKGTSLCPCRQPPGCGVTTRGWGRGGCGGLGVTGVMRTLPQHEGVEDPTHVLEDGGQVLQGCSLQRHSGAAGTAALTRTLSAGG